MNPLEGVRVLTLALNLPGPVAVAELHRLGAAVVKVEPPAGDLLARASPGWYHLLHQGLDIVRLDLKTDDGRSRLEGWLDRSDVLVTSMNPGALRRLNLEWPALHARHPRLCHVAITGYPPPHDGLPGHDLTYQARAGLLDPPQLPRTALADTAGARRAVCAALALLLARERGCGAGVAEVSLAEAAEEFAGPWKYGLTRPGGPLGGGRPGYNLYRTRDGWVAVAALEGHFWEKLTHELGLTNADVGQLCQAFATRTAAEWEAWAVERGLPVLRVRED